MVIEVLRIGERVVRDDRATTHAALVARAFGALCIYMSGIGSGIEESVRKVKFVKQSGKNFFVSHHSLPYAENLYYHFLYSLGFSPCNWFLFLQ